MMRPCHIYRSVAIYTELTGEFFLDDMIGVATTTNKFTQKDGHTHPDCNLHFISFCFTLNEEDGTLLSRRPPFTR